MRSEKVILSYALAKELLAKGFRIIDIDQNKYDSKRTVFVFENTQGLEDYINAYTKHNARQYPRLRTD